MGKLICKIRVAALGFQRGHKWHMFNGNHLAKGAPIMACLRCKENGWMV